MIQLDLFQDIERDDREIMRQIAEARELAKSTYESANKVRRGIFARHGELAKMYLDLNTRLEILERNICSGNAKFT